MTKWLEIIEIRSTGNNRKTLDNVLENLVEKLNKESRQLKIKVYNNMAVDSDYSIHLYLDIKPNNINGSPLGLQLVSVLKDYGLINHSVLIEKYGKKVNEKLAKNKKSKES